MSTESPEQILNSVESLPDSHGMKFDRGYYGAYDIDDGNPSDFVVKEIMSSDRIDDHYRDSLLSESKRAKNRDHQRDLQRISRNSMRSSRSSNISAGQDEPLNKNAVI